MANAISKNQKYFDCIGPAWNANPPVAHLLLGLDAKINALVTDRRMYDKGECDFKSKIIYLDLLDLGRT
jgi:hypothetical protein